MLQDSNGILHSEFLESGQTAIVALRSEQLYGKDGWSNWRPLNLLYDNVHRQVINVMHHNDLEWEFLQYVVYFSALSVLDLLGLVNNSGNSPSYRPRKIPRIIYRPKTKIILLWRKAQFRCKVALILKKRKENGWWWYIYLHKVNILSKILNNFLWI